MNIDGDPGYQLHCSCGGEIELIRYIPAITLVGCTDCGEDIAIPGDHLKAITGKSYIDRAIEESEPVSDEYRLRYNCWRMLREVSLPTNPDYTHRNVLEVRQ